MKKILPYKRKTYYYETDKMGIMHHSNYIRIFEEARVDFMQQVGMPFDTIESRGIMMPVLSVECNYRYPLRFGEEFAVYPKIAAFSGVKLTIGYTIKKCESGDICVTGSSSHCFTDNDLRPIRTKNKYPDIYDLFSQYLDCEITDDRCDV